MNRRVLFVLVAALSVRGAAAQSGAADVERAIVAGIAEAARAERSSDRPRAQALMAQVAAAAGEDRGRLLVMARELEANGLHRLCLQACDQSLKVHPDETGFRAFRAVALMSLKRHVDAAQELTELVRLRPQEARFHALLGSAQLHANREAEALQAIEKALSLEPENAIARALRAEFDYRAHRFEDCEANCRRTLKVDPKNATALTLLVRVRRARGDLAGALADADAAIKILGDHGDALLERGIVLLAAERTADAVRDLEASSRLMPQDVRPWTHLAKAYARLKRPEDAAKAQKRVVELQAKS